MRSLNRVLLTILILLAAAALASFLRAKGDRHRLGGATDLAGTLEPLRSEFNLAADRPRLLMVLAPACPVCLEGAEAVHDQLLQNHRDLQVLAVWMEALPFDITRNPARRIETFAGEPRMTHFYDMEQVSGRALRGLLNWQDDSLPWDVFLLYPPGVTWDEDLPVPQAWFHQREEANTVYYRTSDNLAGALQLAIDAL
jgi:hypothetical protein